MLTSTSTSTSSVPFHLTTDILLRLPAESVVRSRYVSKLWSSITTEPYFTSTFETQCSKRPRLLMFFQKKDKLFVFSFPQHNRNSNSKESYSSQQVESYQMKYTKTSSLSFTESVHGLICFMKDANNPMIWNPSTRQLLTLPEPGLSVECLTVFLGYDPIEGKHKVVCLPSEICDECAVLTLGSAKESWRIIKTNHEHRTYTHFDSYARCINGVLYYHAYIEDPYDDYMIMSFDLRTEKFHMITLPSDDFCGRLINYQGKLACVNRTIDNNGITMWILEDAEEPNWSRKLFLTPFVRSLKTIYRIFGITDTGEFICVPRTFLNSFFVLYFDPVRNSLREVEFKGIADDKFRFSNGLGSKRIRSLHIFPNHIETLLSL